MHGTRAVRLTADVALALKEARPVVALESSVLAQGLPDPANREAAHLMMSAVREAGALPAITAVVQGTVTLGLEEHELERFLRRDGIDKVSARDLPLAVAQKRDGATTVAAAIAIAALAGVSVFATGGIGGVHRDPPFDESADLHELARTPMLVVSAGAKAILDLPATMERLETLGIPVVGYRTSELPAFYTANSGLGLTARAESAAEIAAAFRAHRDLRRPGAMLVVQPPPASRALSRAEVDVAIEEALRIARERGVRGAAVTPFLLSHVASATGGRTLAVNVALLGANARLAAEIAVAL